MYPMPSYGAAVGSDANAAGGTVTQAPKEYIIAEKQLDRVDRCYIEDCDGGCPNSYCPIDIAKEVRSRPHPAPTDEQCRICSQATERKAREQYAEELKKDLKSRFVSQSNQWCKGRNSGLIECCNIIDESLRAQQGGDPE